MSNFDENDWINRRKLYKNKINIDYLFRGIVAKNRDVLSSSITLIESDLLNDQKVAAELIEKCLPLSGNSIRIGVTGVPGVGKSTFIETFGLFLIQLGKKVAVLSVDPASEKTKGSILGDKTRMEELSKSENAFIRPSSSRNQLGGVAKYTKEAMILCEAAGFDVILVETVGVGQSETMVHSMVDFFMLLMLPGAGDELQGIKRGIMELADSIIITKSEKQNFHLVKSAINHYKQALHYFPERKNGWFPKVIPYSCFDTKSIEEIYSNIQLYFESISINDNRKKQDEFWLYEYLMHLFLNDINLLMEKEIKDVKNSLFQNKINVYHAAQLVYNKIKDNYGKN